MKKIILAIMIGLLCLSGCQKKEENKEESEALPSIENYAIQHETEFGGVYIKMEIDDFNALGFTYGDSVDVVFSNGYKLEDIPYYNGYYVNAGEPLLIAYPGYDYIKACINYGDDLWEDALLQMSTPKSLWLMAEASEHDTASVYLHEKGKYLDTQIARDIHYYDERERYPSDIVFANFRNITTGNIKDGILYRSASPCDNQHNRATYVDRLIEEAGVNTILDLADSDTKIEGYIAREDFDCPYFLSLYEKGNVIPLALSMNYLSQEFGEKIARSFVEMSEKEGPYLVHCTEGKDRTGFVCILIEALAGSSYQEIVDDYMLTYDNYYWISENSDNLKYNLIKQQNVDAMLHFIADSDEDLSKIDLSAAARSYLLEMGMEEEQITSFLNRITD